MKALNRYAKMERGEAELFTLQLVLGEGYREYVRRWVEERSYDLEGIVPPDDLLGAYIEAQPEWSESDSADAELRKGRVPVWTIIKHKQILRAHLQREGIDPAVVSKLARLTTYLKTLSARRSPSTRTTASRSTCGSRLLSLSQMQRRL